MFVKTDQDGAPPVTGKQLPSQKELKKLVNHMHAQKIRCFQYTLKKSPRHPSSLTINYLIRHEDVMDILRGKNRNKVNTSHYDELIKTASGYSGIMNGRESDDLKKRWEILHAALAVSPKYDRTMTTKIDRLAKTHVQNATRYIQQRKYSRGQFNAVREYGYLVSFLCAKEFFGFAMPKKPSFLTRIFMYIRNGLLPGRISLKGDMGESSALLMWIQLMALHIFANVGRRNKVFGILGRMSAKRIRKQIEYSLSKENTPPAGSLIHRFQSVRGKFKITDTEYDNLVGSILLELISDMALLPGQAFSHILRLVNREKINDKKISPRDFLELIEKYGDVVIDEALRCNPVASMLFRMVEEPFYIDNKKLKEREVVCLLLDEAGRDPLAFKHPLKFAYSKTPPIVRDRCNYLNFGAFESKPAHPFRAGDNLHPCFGQYWARAMIIAMFEGLRYFADLELPEEESP